MHELFKNLVHLMTHRDKVDSDGFRALMDQILNGVNVGWELGVLPDHHAVDQLSLSVMYNVSFIEQAAAYVQLPITGEGWQIDVGIPPRDWAMYFQVQTDDGQVVDIAGSEWTWRMSNDTDMATIFLSPPSSLRAKISEKDLLDCADLLVIGELGEVNFLNHLAAIELLPSSQGMQPTVSALQLRKAFVEQYPHCQYADWMKASRRNALPPASPT